MERGVAYKTDERGSWWSNENKLMKKLKGKSVENKHGEEAIPSNNH